MLKGVRRMIILASMKRRQPSILAREEWKSIPWMSEDVAERAEYYLWNVLADYTVLVADHEEGIGLREGHTSPPAARNYSAESAEYA